MHLQDQVRIFSIFPRKTFIHNYNNAAIIYSFIIHLNKDPIYILIVGSGSSNPSPLGGNASPVSNGSNNSDQTNTKIPLSAAEIMAAASAAVGKQKQGNSSLTGGKIRLNSTASSTSATTSGSKFPSSGNSKVSGGNATSSKHTNGTNSTHSSASSGSSDNSNISTNGNGDNNKVNSKVPSKNGCNSSGSGGGKDSDKHRGDKNRGGVSSTSSNKKEEPPSKKQKVRLNFLKNYLNLSLLSSM